jgi:hypothetical protein
MPFTTPEKREGDNLKDRSPATQCQIIPRLACHLHSINRVDKVIEF